MRRKVCVVTPAHLATCPRMLKAADALHETGYSVRVVSARFVPWAEEADRDLRASRNWQSCVVDYSRSSGRLICVRSALRQRLATVLVRALGISRAPLALVERAYLRIHPELVRVVAAEPVELVYGGGASFAAVARAAMRMGTRFAVDLEDFHRAEQEASGDDAFANQMAERLERAVLERAAFITAGSEAIAAAYAHEYDVEPIPINNVFPLPESAPDLSQPAAGPLRLYWFSQTIGPGRGLEDAVRAMGLAQLQGELHLRGRPSSGYLEFLRRLADQEAPTLRIVHHEPAAPDLMIELSRSYDVGLALERRIPANRNLCLTNKILTYILAGLAVACTGTVGQKAVSEDLGEGALLFAPGDVPALAEGLQLWATDKRALARARAASWEAAKRRWHWEHPLEKGALLAAIDAALA